MNRDITLGQYYNVDSPVHRLDPRTKLFATLVFVVSLFFPCGIPGLLLATIFLGALIGLSRLPVLMVFRGIRPLRIILLFTAVMNLFFSKGQVIWRWGPFTLSKEGIVLTVFLIIRLVYLVAGSSIMTYTTTPKDLADGLEKSLHFLTIIYLPVHEFAMMMSIAMRFIPILMEELDRIMKAQMSRGADFETGNLIEKGKRMIPILIPLFISAIRRASELALAMDARCYHGGEGRTKLHPLTYGLCDGAAYLVAFGYLALMLILWIMGAAGWIM